MREAIRRTDTYRQPNQSLIRASEIPLTQTELSCLATSLRITDSHERLGGLIEWFSSTCGATCPPQPRPINRPNARAAFPLFSQPFVAPAPPKFPQCDAATWRTLD